MSIFVRKINGMGSATDSVAGAVTHTGADDADFGGLASDKISAEGIVDMLGGDLLVTENSPQAANVLVAKGTAYVENRSWSANSQLVKYYEVVVTAAETVTITANASGNPRIDAIAIKVDRAATPDDNASNVGTIIAIPGTPGATPARPSLPVDSNDYLILGYVAVANGFSVIADADITDARFQVNFKQDGGWEARPETYTRTSATELSAAGVDLTDLMKPNLWIRVYQDDGWKYWLVRGSTFSTNTSIPIAENTTYTLTTSDIERVEISHAKNPEGAPYWIGASGRMYLNTAELNLTDGASFQIPYETEVFDEFGDLVDVAGNEFDLPIAGKWCVQGFVVMDGLENTTGAAGARSTLVVAYNAVSQNNRWLSTPYRRDSEDVTVQDYFDMNDTVDFRVTPSGSGDTADVESGEYKTYAIATYLGVEPV